MGWGFEPGSGFHNHSCASVKGWLIHFRSGWNPAQLIAVYGICLHPSRLLSVESCFLKAHKEKQGIHECDQWCVVWTDGAGQQAGKGLTECWVTEPGSSWPCYENGSSSWSVRKITLSPNSYIGWRDYPLRFVGIAEFVKGRAGGSCRKFAVHLRKTVPLIRLLHQVESGFSPARTYGANSAWIPEDLAPFLLKDH